MSLRKWFSSLLVIGWAASLAAQEAPQGLLIGPGDRVHVHVLETPDLDQTAQVDDKGQVALLLIGPTNVGGSTAAEAALTIQRRLQAGNFLLNPHVTLSIEKFATQNVTVSGQVRVPGSYAIDTPRTVIDVLAMAGGLNDTADRTVTVEHVRTKELVNFFVDNDSRTALSKNIAVYPGDRVVVAKAATVYVLGDVPKPGGYARLTNNGQITVLQALAQAGGVLHTGRANQTRLLRKAPDGALHEETVRVEDIEKGHAPDFALGPDDILFVPFSYWRQFAQNADTILAVAATAAIYRF